MTTRATGLITSLITALLIPTACASVTFTPPDSNKPMRMGSVPLIGQKGAPKASGTASLMGNMDHDRYVVAVQAVGLDPKKVYTVWFLSIPKGKGAPKMQGIGTTPYILKVDSKGRVEVSYNFTVSPLKQWNAMEIVEHPDKNPRSTKKMVPVLMGDFARLKS